MISSLFLVGCNVNERHGYETINTDSYEFIRWANKSEFEGYSVNCDMFKCCKEAIKDLWCYEITTIEEFDEESYKLGLVRGCDIGCIDYDLRIHNVDWSTPEEDYSVLNSTGYQQCSNTCLNSFRDEE